jgi:lysophospholipase
VSALVLRGQGRSSRLTPRYDLGHVRDYANLSSDLAGFVARQRGPVVVLGLSQGAHVALRMAAEHDPDVRAYATIVPMIGLRTAPLPRSLARLMADTLAGNGASTLYLPGTVPWHRRQPFEELLGRGTVCQPDPSLAHLRRALMEVDPTLRVEVPSPGWVSATFASIDRLGRLASRIHAPVLMVTAGRDGVVRTEAAARMCARMSDCRRVHLPRAPHCMVEGDADRSAAVMARVTAFFAAAP